MPYYFTYNGSLITEDEFNSYTYIRSNENGTFSNGESIVVPEAMAGESDQSSDFSQSNDAVEIYAPTVDSVEGEVTTFAFEDELNAVDMTYINKISNALDFIFNTNYNGYNLNYGEISKEAFLLSIDNDYREELLERYNNITVDRGGYFVLDKNQSIRYAVKFRDTGKVLTNSGVTPTDNRQAIIQRLGGELIESFENGKYVPAKEKKPHSDGFLSQLYYELVEDFYVSTLTYLSSTDSTVEWAYFSYNPEMSDGDILTVSERLHNAHSSKITRSAGFALTASIVFFLIACAIGIWLISAAGKTEEGEVKTCFCDKIPFEINLVLALGVMALSAVGAYLLVVYELFPSNFSRAGTFEIRLVGILGTISSPASALLVAIFFAAPTALLMSIARNARAKTFTKYTLCRYIFMPVIWIFKKSQASSKILNISLPPIIQRAKQRNSKPYRLLR